MCLYDKRRFRLSLYPIRVYKVVTLNNESAILREPLLKYNNTHMHNAPFLSASGDQCIGNGFYHAFTSKDSAIKFMKNLPNISGKFKIISGWIPPFVRIGRNRFKREICSRVLILNL